MKNKENSGVVSMIGTGRIGDVRFYVRNGVRIMRVATRSGGNPHTDAQMRSMAKWGNMVNLWREMKGKIAGLVERQVGKDSYRMFLSDAAKSVPIYLDKLAVANGACVAIPCRVSDGSLPSIGYAMNEDGVLVSDVKVGDGFVVDENTTVKELMLELITYNDCFERDDEIIFLAARQTYDPYGQPHVRLQSYSVGMKDSEGKAKVLDMAGQGFYVVDGCLAMNGEPEAGCYAWVHVRRDDKGLVEAVSTQVLYNANTEAVGKYSSDEAFESAKPSYGKAKKQVFLSPDKEERSLPPTPPEGKGDRL